MTLVVLTFSDTTGGVDQGEHQYGEENDKSNVVDDKAIKNDEVDSDAETIDSEFEAMQAARASEVTKKRHIRDILGQTIFFSVMLMTLL